MTRWTIDGKGSEMQEIQRQGIQRNKNGGLDYYAFPGGYSLVYICADGETVCARCANEWEEGEWEGQEPVDADVYWEGPPLNCANCNETIESAYGDPDCPENN